MLSIDWTPLTSFALLYPVCVLPGCWFNEYIMLCCEKYYGSNVLCRVQGEMRSRTTVIGLQVQVWAGLLGTSMLRSVTHLGELSRFLPRCMECRRGLAMRILSIVIIVIVKCSRPIRPIPIGLTLSRKRYEGTSCGSFSCSFRGCRSLQSAACIVFQVVDWFSLLFYEWLSA